MGTPEYMAPEQVEGAQAVDTRADLYALGITLYELLIGTPPFKAETPWVTLSQHLTKAPRPPIEIRPDIPPGPQHGAPARTREATIATVSDSA